MVRSRRVLLALSALLVPAGALVAQVARVPTIILRGSVGRLVDGFSGIRAIRELSDGRVLVSLSSDPHLVVADYQTGSFEQVGSVGSGPGEYRGVTAVFALSGDSTLVLDAQQARWVILSGTKPVATLRSRTRGMWAEMVDGADTLGRVLELAAQRYPAGSHPAERYRQNAESLAVVVHRRSGPRTGDALSVRSDTLAVIRGAFREVRRLTRGSYGGAGIRYTLYTILDGAEQAVMFGDGWVAVVHANPYHVVWHAPDGRRTIGPLLPFERVPVDETQKLAAVARDWPKSPTLFKPEEYPPWPRVLPPFEGSRAAIAMSDGRLAIRRTPDPRSKAIYYDLVDRSGRLSARLQISENEQLFGITGRWAYVARRDQDDLLWLERYSWPPS